MHIKTRETCRICNSRELLSVLSLGEQFVTNFLDIPTEEAFKGPLETVLCNEKTGGCGLLQLKHTVERDVLYRKYWYRSGVSTTMVSALRDIVRCAENIVDLLPGDIVVDIGANDGTLLRQYSSPNIIMVGFEPSNLWELGTEGVSKVINDYFSYELFRREFGGRKSKIITSIAMFYDLEDIAMFYDLEDPNTFVEDIKKCLEMDGLWVIQMNYLGLMLENNTFDNISHEHLAYYSLLSLENLLRRHDMEVIDVELKDVNGGSFRTYVKHSNGKVKTLPGAEERLQKQRHYERTLNLHDKVVYDEFAQRINKISVDLKTFLEREKKNGEKIFIYGASTRGLVVLQFAGIDHKLIDAATDKNPDKWGKYIVGTGIKILPIEEYRKAQTDYLFVLPYQFINEIAKQERDFLTNGGKMILAIPNLRVISKSYLTSL